MRKETNDKIENIINKFKTVDLKQINTTDKFIKIESYKVKINNGEEFYRDKIVKNNGYGSSASILPILENGNILLIGEPRVFTDTTVELCIPGGYIDKDENEYDAAKRELSEETGLVSDNIKKVAEYYVDLGNSDHISNIFIAYDCKYKADINLDIDEFVEPLEVTFEELEELIDNGTIKNSSTIIAFLKYKEQKTNK